MSAREKRTPALVAEVTKLNSEGASAREIAEAVGVSPQAVCRWLRSLGLEPRGGFGSRKSRKRAGTSAATTPQMATQRRIEALVAQGAKEAARGTVEAGPAALRDRLDLVRRTINEMWPSAVAGTGSPAALSTLASLEIKYATELQRFEPKKPVDPDSDPVNQDLAAQVTRKLRLLVEDEEKKAARKNGTTAPPKGRAR